MFRRAAKQRGKEIKSYGMECGFDLQLEGFAYRNLEDRGNEAFMAEMKERGGTLRQG